MRTKRALVALAAVALLVTGCAPTVALQPAAHATSARCASVIAEASVNNPTVSGLPARNTNAQGTAAWGDPAAILLYCGVPVPDPTSALPCISVDGVFWLRDDRKAPTYTFTTYGRDPAVSVVIDSRNVKADANQALTDLAPTINDSIDTDSHRCVALGEVLQGGVPVTTPTPVATPTPTPTPRATLAPGATPVAQ